MPLAKSYSWSIIESYREETFCMLPNLRVASAREAIQFVDQRGFVFFWPISAFVFPSLCKAVAGNRPVASNQNDPAHITWSWKDDLLDKKVWYYAKVLRQKSTIISLKLLPSFYALSPNYGEPEEDYLISYQDGNLSMEEKQIYEALLLNGPLDSIALRNESRLASSANAARFNRALNLLMRDFRVLPIGIAHVGAWNYAYVYDVVHRQFPNIIEKAHRISELDARVSILKAYFLSLGASRLNDIHKLFQWPQLLIDRAMESLLKEHFLVNQVKFRDVEGEWWMLTDLAGSKQ